MQLEFLTNCPLNAVQFNSSTIRVTCICSGECSAVHHFENGFAFRINNFEISTLVLQPGFAMFFGGGGRGKVCLELTTERFLFGPDVLGVCYHVFLEGDFQPHEQLNSQSLGENITLAQGRVSTLVSDPYALYIT